jgi:regulator of protease activity HflC (stomatin/prohibitin superfamily)
VGKFKGETDCFSVVVVGSVCLKDHLDSVSYNPFSILFSYVFDVVRSTVPKMELDEAFASKAEIAEAVLGQLKDVMKEYGYEILNTLVTDMAPDRKVKASMNEINASKRLKEAAAHKAEADKIKLTKAAEAEAESRYLSGLGVARQRKAIVQGLQESVMEFSNEVGTRPKVSFTL